jgi:curli biogenesis system outer membrane secretion channel CsgG
MKTTLFRTLTAAAILTLNTLFVPMCLAGVVDVNLETEGTGTSLKAAVNDALTAAVSQVNGMEIATQTVHAVAEASVQSKDNQAYFASDAFRQQVQTASKGIVKNFRVLHAQQNSALGNLWVARVSATIAKYQASEQIKRLRMAVVPFRIAPASTDPKNASKFESMFGQELVSYLTQTRKFAILDRNHFKEQKAEFDMIKGDGFSLAEMARIGNQVGTDYLIVGTVNDFKETRWTQRMQSTGKEFNLQRLDLQLAYRIIDVATGQIKFSDTYRYGEESQGSGFDHMAIARKAANSIGEKIINAIYPIVVASVREKTAYLSQGGNTLRVGQRLDVIKLGAPITDPYTKESLGREETRVGEIEVTDVQAKLAQAVIVKSTVDIAADFAAGNYIVRPSVVAQKPQPPAVSSAPAKPVKKDPNAAAKSNDDEW